MFKYGIKLFWAGWGPHEHVVGFSPKGYQTWKNTIGIGTRMLVYETEETGDRFSATGGQMAIIGEVEVTGKFYKDELLAPSPAHPWLVPVDIIRAIPDVKPISLSEVRKIINDKTFPLKGDTWRKLDDRQYYELTAKWD